MKSTDRYFGVDFRDRLLFGILVLGTFAPPAEGRSPDRYPAGRQVRRIQPAHPYSVSSCAFDAASDASERTSTTPTSPPTSRPADGDKQTQEVVERVRKLLVGEGGLRWSSVDQEPRRFEFRLRLALPVAKGAPRVSRYLVVRDGTHVAVLVTTDDGLPVYYLTDGLFVGPDSERAGGLCVFEGGEPTVKVTSGDSGSALALDISFTQAGRRQVVLDVASVLRAALRKTLAASPLPGDAGLLMLRTERAEVRLNPSPSTHDAGSPNFGIDSLSVRTPAGMEFDLSQLRAGAGQASPGMISTSRRTIDELGLPIRILDANAAAPTTMLVVPDGFPRDLAERQAADKMQTLFDGSRNNPSGTAPSAK